MCRYRPPTDELKIELSERLFNELKEMDKTDVVIHEMAHAICFRLNLDRGHGPVFKSVAKAMGGSGERCISLKPGVVKRNLVKRWVLTRRSNPGKLFIRTRKDADNLPYVYADVVLLGVIQVDQNAKKVKWMTTKAPEIRKVNPLEGEYELVA